MNQQKNLRAIEKACRLGDKTFRYIFKKIKPGITEKQLAFEIKLFIKKHGGSVSFRSIVAFGANSSTPHHRTGETILGPSTHFARSGREGQIILLDFGVKLNNYCSDMTRVVFLGKVTKEQKKIYRTVVAAQKKALETLYNRLTHYTTAIRAREIDKVARDYIINAGFPPMPHGLGHGIGLKVHEPPRLSPKSRNVLKPVMVFSIEPGIYLPGKFGIRIEDIVVLEKSGPRVLTRATKEIIEI